VLGAKAMLDPAGTTNQPKETKVFSSKEKKEQRKQIEARIAELQAYSEKLKRQHDGRLRELNAKVEGYRQSISPKWECLEVSSKNIQIWGSLDNLGSQGWELVGIATYTEKETYGATVHGTIYTVYVFKRPAHDVPDALLAEYDDLPALRREVQESDREIAELQEEMR
jgi:hypothetical protein